MNWLQEHLTDIQASITGLEKPALTAQIGVLLIGLLVAWLIHRYFLSYLSARTDNAQRGGLRRLTLRGLQRILMPLGMLLAVLLGRAILQSLEYPVPILNLAVPLILSLAGIRILVYLLRKGFPTSDTLKAWENVVSTVIWLVVALHLLGWLPGVLDAMDALAFKVGKVRVSLLSVATLVLLVGLFFTLALWLSNIIERRVRDAQYMNAGMRVGLAKFSKFFLLTLAVVLALDAVGIDLTTLTVFGGALGVGLGFGLQRIASNFISGFILILDRSIRPGDVISVGNKFGWVQELRARYVVVMDRDGVETLIPNENLVTTDVINWSYSNRNVRLKIPVQISYGDDPELGLKIMLEAANVPRVLKDPPPVCRLMEFGDNGITLELRVWINDPENGISNVRSDVNLAIWRGFKQAGITIPFPQRDVHVKGLQLPGANPAG